MTFRLNAPNANSVVVRGDFPSGLHPSALPMSKDEAGVWSLTVGPLRPELRIYTFLVDGVAMPDPRNPNYRRENSQISSTLLIPGAESDVLAVKPVPHGTVSQVWYASPHLDKTRRAIVYMPPGYETDRKRYPVLYLLHGGAQDEDAWPTEGRAAQILDNLIAAGKARPMIIVMPNGNSPQTAARSYVSPQEPAPGGQNIPFAESITTDLIPFIDRTYRTLPDRYSRAIAGLSMGGGHTWFSAFNNIETYGYV